MSKGRNTTVVGVRLPDEIVAKLKALSRSRRQTISELMTQAVREFVDYSHLSDIHRQVALGRIPPFVETKKEESYPEVSRNALCPCGSGLKYKRCHGK